MQGKYSTGQSADGRRSIYDLQEQGEFGKARDLYESNLKSTDQFAEDNITQSNITNLVDEKTGKSLYNPDFAKAVEIENQKATGTYISGEEQDNQPTFICTALYEMGQMPIGIYKYDQRYGQSVNRRIYNGYSVWGKPIARKMRNRGLLYKIITPIAKRWAEQMAFDISKGKVGKKRYSIKIMKFLGETICYGIGLFIKPEGDTNGINRNRQYGKERGTVSGKNGVSKKRGRPRIKRRTAS